MAIKTEYTTLPNLKANDSGKSECLMKKEFLWSFTVKEESTPTKGGKQKSLKK